MPHPPTSPPPAGERTPTLRSEVWALQRLLGDDTHPWMGMDRQQRRNVIQLLDMALRAPDSADLATLAERAEREQDRLAALATWDDARVAQRAAWQRTRTPFGPTTYQQAHDATMLASEALNALCVLLDQQRAAGAVAAPGGSGRGEEG